MPFLRPEYLWLAPLLAAPILIHLLNRIRYRRVRWAAIDFLLTSEKRAVRRAQLKQILLMALRTLVLAAALLALLRPLLGGGLARLFGEGDRVVVLLDASASMSAESAAGAAFVRARRQAEEALRSLPRSVRVMAGTFAVGFETPFREPLRDRDAVARFLADARRLDGAGDVPAALRAAADRLAKTGKGGVLWLLTDLRAAGWRAADTGVWEAVRRSLDKAGGVRVVVSDLDAGAPANFAVEALRLTPAAPVAGDSPKLTATVAYFGKGRGETAATLFFDGRKIDARPVTFPEPGRQDVVFRLPPLKPGAHVGRLVLQRDAVPADDVHHFALRTEAGLPLLIVEGAPSSRPFEGSAAFVTLAFQPPAEAGAARSPFRVTQAPPEALEDRDLADYAAVVLTNTDELTPAAARSLKAYVEAGGMMVLFPGARTRVASWTKDAFPGVALRPTEPAGEDGLRVDWVDPKSRITATLPAEGLSHVRVKKTFPLDGGPSARTLMMTQDGRPLLLRVKRGRGVVYVFGVSAQTDFSNFPLTPAFLTALHRMVAERLSETATPLSRPACAELKTRLAGQLLRALTPDGRVLPFRELASQPGWGALDDTAVAGLYRLTAARPGARPSPDESRGPVLAAVNPPPSESSLERIREERVRELLAGHAVAFVGGDGHAERLGAGGGKASAASVFPLALLALVFLLGEVALAWSIDRPPSRAEEGDGG